MPSLADKPRVNAAIAIVVRDDNSILVSRRRADDTLGGYWEFPGGKCEDGETLEQCVVRELREELNITAMPLRKLDPIDHDYPHMRLRLHPFLCRYEHGEMKFLECETACWIRPADLRGYQFPPANDGLIDQVISLLAPPT